MYIHSFISQPKRQQSILEKNRTHGIGEFHMVSTVTFTFIAGVADTSEPRTITRAARDRTPEFPDLLNPASPPDWSNHSPCDEVTI